MNIIIAGGGVVGSTLAENLAQEDNEIIMIEKDPDLLEKLLGKIDMSGIVGNAASYEILRECGIAETDIFIAVTHNDEINMIACSIAKAMGAAYTIARVRNPDYAKSSAFMSKELGINFMINPEREAARDIANVLRFVNVNSVEYFVDNRLVMISMLVTDHAPVTGMTIMEFGRSYDSINVVALVREDQVIVPSGSDRIHAKDEIYVIGGVHQVRQFYEQIGQSKEQIRNSLIIGGGTIAFYLIEKLNQMKVGVKVIEEDLGVARHLADSYPEIIVVQGDGSDQEFLDEEHISHYDSVICLREVDEENILTSLYALSVDVNKVITKVTNVSLLKILGDVGLQTVVTPKFIISDKILRFIRSLKSRRVSSFEALYRFNDNEAEVIQFLVNEESQIAGNQLKDILLIPHTTIAAIVRNHDIIIPRGNDTIQPGDHVIIVTLQQSLDDIDDFLAEGENEE